MKTIHKYPLVIAAHHSFQLPAGATILNVDLDPTGRVCLWALVDTDQPPEMRRFVIVGTGHDVPDGLLYHGSVVQGGFVWHVFEEL